MKNNIKKIIAKKGALAENEVKDLLRAYDIPTTKYEVVENEEDLQNISLKFPVALKVCSDKILHKTDVGGVKLSIQNKDDLIKVFKDFRKRFPSEKLLVDQMEKKGIEIIIGLIRDPTFGLSIMLGVGGIFTELYKDVVFRVVPITQYDVEQMLTELKGRKILEDFRNMKTDRKAVTDLLLRVSEFGQEFGRHLGQMDLNPVFVYEKGLCVIDAKLILE